MPRPIARYTHDTDTRISGNWGRFDLYLECFDGHTTDLVARFSDRPDGYRATELVGALLDDWLEKLDADK